MARFALALAALAVLSATGCAARGETDSRRLTVFAAASLTEAFTQIGKDFEAAVPGTKVTFNFGGSTTLARQITEGAPADVFAAASPTTMVPNAAATTFARNRLTIAVPKGNPGRITGLPDFADDTRKIALCAAQVPCGEAAKKAFTAAGVTPAPDTLEQDVKAALTKVRLGEVDAALVYRTDAKAAAETVESIDFPQAAAAVNDYPITVLTTAPNKPDAQSFVDYVLSDRARATLTRAGFEAP
ncbi:molybdate ABC transporter substrate-binding protein [Actinokineospora iranica]|uniref:Molybdate transport system substrate-binding protein n=1 Tax=Actinokineospora iranica TaxID=1271860 RepID=A0A1G6M954_9PSEU|nr:molybdate ABC transporter substrate-binding protein [Actinokineospora iranica]SDC52088.1 molybdate transport system substrate-binding protein [Actinokineospora iranica]